MIQVTASVRYVEWMTQVSIDFLNVQHSTKKSEKIMGIAVASYKMKGKNGSTYLSRDITNM